MEILETTIVHEWKFLNKVELLVKNDKWQVLVWEWVERTGTWNAVWVLVENKEKWVFVLVEQFRPLVNKRVMELVAGLHDEWETEEQTAIKEIKEETGYTTDKIQFLLRWPKSAWLSSESSSYFYAEVSGEAWNRDLWEAELTLEVIEVKNSITALLELCNKKEEAWVIVCPDIWSAVWRAQALWIEFNK